MKLSNFELTKTKGSSPTTWEYFADVDVTTESGMLWWKKSKTTRRQIRKEYAGMWHFVDNGEFTPVFQAERLARAWKAQTGQDC